VTISSRRLAAPNLADPALDVGASTVTPRWFGAALGLLGGAVTFVAARLGSGRSYEYDEGVTVGYFVDARWFEAFRSQRVANNHPLFSFLEQLVWKAGATSESAMRLLPAVFAATAVGILTYWAYRRWGFLAGVVAGITLLLNPLFLSYSHQVRGYTLLVLAGIVSSLIAIKIVESDDHSYLWEVSYIASAAVGIATHLYMLPILAGHAGLVVARRRLSIAWARGWAAAIALGSMAYVNTLPERRAGMFQPRLPIDVAEVLLGDTGSRIAAACMLYLCLAALWHHRRDALAVAVPLALLAWVWAVMQPLDLYPRFFVFLSPAVAVAAASTVSRQRAALLPFAVSTAMVISSVTWTPPDSGLKAVAAALSDRSNAGDQVCAVGSEALAGYTRRVTEFGPGKRCDAIALIGSWEPAGLSEALEDLGTAQTFGSVTIRSSAFGSHS
jgi:hypothetical protein